MNVIEAWDDFTSSEKLMFQNCCRKILRRTFLVRDKQEDRKHYFFVVNHNYNPFHIILFRRV